MKIDGVSAIALILIASFAVDRIVVGSLFLLSFSKAWLRKFPEPSSLDTEEARAHAEKKKKLVYYVLAGFLGIVVLAGLANLRIFNAMGIKPEWAVPAQGETTSLGSVLFYLMDCVFTGLLLIGGADRIANVLKMPGASGAERPEPKPIQITGKLIIEDSAGRLSGSVNATDT